MNFSRLLMCFALWVFGSGSLFGQVSGVKAIPTDYATIADFVTDINTNGIGAGGVTLNIPSGYTETAPAGGFTITATGTVANPIIIQGTGGAPLPIITASASHVVGSVHDAVFELIGSDYVTIAGLDLRENAANTVATVASNTMTEFGIAMFMASATNGSQNNSFIGNTITLGATYQNAIGIFATSSSSSTNSALIPTAVSGTNSNNKVYGNTISSVAYGVYFICEPITATLFETGNDIGGSSAATGNTITFGNNTAGDLGFTRFSGAQAIGINFRNGHGNSTRFNTVTTNSGLTRAIFGYNQNAAATGVTYTSTVSNNTFNLTTVGTTAVTGLDFGSGLSTGTIVASNNSITINQNVSAAASANITAIRASYTSATSTISTNTITINQSTSAGSLTSTLLGVNAAGAGTTVNVTGNTINVNQAAPTGTGSYGSGDITYIDVNAASGTINVTGNTLNNSGLNVRTTGVVKGVNQDATVTALFNVKSNTINVNRTAAGTSYFAFTSTSPSEVADTISLNNITFTGITGSSTVTAIQSYGGPSAGGTKNINNNTIVINGASTATVTGIGIGYATNSNVKGNNITITSGASVNGILSNTGAAIINYLNNTIGLTSSGTGSTLSGINIQVGSTGTLNSNVIHIASTAGGTSTPVINGMLLATGTNTVRNNEFSALTTVAGTGAVAINGVNATGGTSLNLSNNKFFNLQNLSSAGLVSGVLIAGGTSTTIANNLISGLTAPNASVADAIRGINITSSTSSSGINVYYNTIYLNATSAGTNFGTTGIFHTVSGTATTAALDMRNNIIINESGHNGTGLTVAYRRSGTGFANYASTSNRNMLYAGVASAANLIFTDGTTPQQTILGYQGVVAPRDVNSFGGESPFAASGYGTAGNFFISLTGSSSDFLRPVAGITTQVESGAATISGITTDYTGATRPSSPDLGAYEFTGVTPTPVITLNSVTPPTTAQCTASARVVSVNITTASGTITGANVTYTLNGAAQSPIAMTNVSGSTWTATIPAAVPANATIAWGVVATNSVGLNGSYIGTTYSDEPLLGATASASASSTTVCASSPTTLTATLIKPGTVVTGTGSGTSSSAGISPFYHGYGGVKTQYIYRASELTAMGLVAGNITALSLNITSLGTTPMNSFSINMGHTAQNAAVTNTAIVSGLTQVYSNAAQALVAGTNTYTFSTPFNWDGVSNVVISITYTNVNTGGTSSTVTTDPAVAFTSSLAIYADNASAACLLPAVSSGQACMGTNSNTTTSTRPTFTLTGNKIQTISSVSWSDGVATVGTTNPLSVSPTATTTYTATITAAGCIFSPAPTVSVTVNPLPAAPTATNSAQCGVQVPTASVSSTSGLPTPTFKWYAASTGGSALQTSTSTTYTSTVAATTTFYVSELNTTTGCESTRTPVTVNVSTPDQVSLTPSVSAICLGGSFTLTAANISGTPLQNYTYSTQSATAGSGAQTPLAGATVSVTPTAAGSFTYTVSAVDGGCAASATATVVVNALPAIASATATPATVCSGNTITLTGNISSSNATSATLGTSTTTEFGGGVYRNGYGIGDFRHQLLYTAAEMTAAGFAAGSITSLTFNVSSAGSGSANNYTIKLANVATAGPLTGTFATGTFTTVYSAATYTAISGNNTHTFSTPFVWDGTSNILVDICYNISVTGSSSTLSATTPSVVSNANLLGSAGACSATGGGTTYANRPLIAFTMNYNSNYNWLWSPGTGLNTPVATTSITNTSGSAMNQAFTVTVTNPATGCSATSTTPAVTINPAPAAPVANNATQCGTGNTTVSVTGSGTPGNTFSWYLVPTGGTAISGQTGSSLSAYSISATTTFYVSESNGTCSGTRTAVTATVTTPPAISVSGTATICNGGSTALTASSTNDPNYTYTWSGGLGTGATVTASPTANTTYTVTATDASGGANNGCVTTATYAIVVNPVPTSVVASVNDASICNGETVNLSSSATSNSANVPVTALTQNFNSGFGTWATTVSGTAPATAGFVIQTPPYSYTTYFSNFATANGGGFAMSNADLTGSGNKVRTTLVSPSFSTVGLTSANLTFENLYQKWSSGDSLVRLEISTNGGSTWATLKDYLTLGNQGVNTSNAQVPANENISLASYLNQANLKIRFNYVTTYGYYWVIDNVVVSGLQPAAPTYSWTSSPAGFTSTAQNPTGVAPTVSTNYTVTVSNSYGCSASSSVAVTVNQPTSATVAQTACDTYTWPINGATYTTSGTHTATIMNAAGCDSVITLNLTIKNSTSATVTQTACDTYTWPINGATYTTSGTHTATIPNAAGCDSVITLNLTINNSTSATVNQSACSSYTWPINGQTYTTSGTHTATITNAAGCDSVITLNLTINNPTTGTDVQSACGSYTWIDGVTYTASNNTATFTIAGGNSNGCDSIVTLNLTINNATTGTDVQTACVSYTWIDGVTYTSSNNTATFTIVGGNSNGCDSVVTLDLTILQPATSSVTITECTSYTWAENGITYTTSGAYTATLPNAAANGCDSIITLNLTIIQPTTSSVSATACSSYTWAQNGMTYTASGAYTDTIPNASGCDSVITLNLTINTPTSSVFTVSTCSPSYTWAQNGMTYTASGMYNDTITNAAGCDSVVTLNLTITTFVATATDNGNATATASAGTTYQWINCTTNTPIAGATAQTFAATANGSYAVIVSNGTCSDTSNCVNITNVGIKEHAISTIEVHPNPTHDVVFVTMDASSAVVEVMDAQGKLVQTTQIKSGDQINLSAYERGVYTLRIKTDSGTSIERIVKN
ncbi:T9SS type A sorting domain-containing protein [Fluviicola sp.]|uniref:Ig-like domain-containing protein n=1 Tax=Fluviicola sp. TaxID=1917219 RepID=UPI0031E1282E